MRSAKLIVGNWKMNGVLASLVELTKLSKLLDEQLRHDVGIVVCPPATLLHSARVTLAGSPIETGAQDCHGAVSGAHTGDLSAAMIADLGAKYVIVGHSERRSDHGETSVDVAAKASAAIIAGLTPIICVGESEAQRDAGQAEVIVLDQVLASIPIVAQASQICIAYEPVWAIGTGRTPSPSDVAAMHASIRETLVKKFGAGGGHAIKILYGGSVNPKNAAELLAVAHVDGALVGGASLSAESFAAIVAVQL
jgi:triosephosphate isomerase (TIM)